MARLETTLFDLQDAYSKLSPGAEAFGDFLNRYPPQAKTYVPDASWLGEALRRVKTLINLAADWRSKPLIQDGKLPNPPGDLRITPRP